MATDSENLMSLKNLIWQYKEHKDSGLLSIKVEGQEHLLKIYFELGMVVGLSLGTHKNEECLGMLGTCKPVEAAFMKGYKTPDVAAAAKEEINNKLEGIFASFPVTGGIAGEGAQSVHVGADDLRNLESDFINIIGPIGTMIIETAYTEIGYLRGHDMPSPQYSQLIDKIKQELPAQHQDTFAAKYAMGLGLRNKKA